MARKKEAPSIRKCQLSARFDVLLVRQIRTFSEHTDISLSRFLQRAAENELERRAERDPKLKSKLERIKKNGK